MMFCIYLISIDHYRRYIWQRKRSFFLLLLLTIVIQNACAQRIDSVMIPQIEGSEDRSEYRFSPDDVIDINVWKNPDLSRQVTVRPDGKISLPLVGDISAAGFTPEEVASTITRELSSYYKEPPPVSVIVQVTKSSSIYIIGEVANQGKFEMRDEMTLLHAIAIAGGFSEFASRKKIIIRRKIEGGEEVTIGINYKNVIAGLEENIQLVPEDMIIVQ